MPGGYAVVDVETTGIHTGYHHRIAEIAVIGLDNAGQVTNEWSTLVNPDRDLGPQAIHGIRAADIRKAPSFGQIAGDVVERLRGRIPVAHNWQFDAMHLRAEFARIGLETPFTSTAGLCTMQAAGLAGIGVRRSLIDCCAVARLRSRSWHTARDDALATADLFGHILHRRPDCLRVTTNHCDAAIWRWPHLAQELVAPVHRTPASHVEPHFLARLVERMPRDDEPRVDAYFAMLDNALLDRNISATEGDALLDLAYDLGLHKSEVIGVHYSYLRQLARAVWDDGVLTDEERADVDRVATLLGLDPQLVPAILDEEHGHTPTTDDFDSVRGVCLRPGDKIVLTGTMARNRAEIVHQAQNAGLRVSGSVSRQTRIVVTADDDSLSRKAKDARILGIPVVGEAAFLKVLDSLPPQESH